MTVTNGCVTAGSEIDSLDVLSATPSPDFQQDGTVAFSILPMDALGEVVLSENLDLEVYLNEVAADGDSSRAPQASSPDELYTVTIQFTEARAPDERPIVYALDMDSSGSMADSDPLRLIVPAGQKFIQITADRRAGSEYGIFTFGQGGSRSFNDTLVLEDFTADTDAAEVAIEGVSADGGTPLYESALEVLEHFETQRSGADWQRALVLFSDGEPNNGMVSAQQVISRALELQIPLYTMGLGPASQNSPDSRASAVAVMQELAYTTGGSYVAVTGADDLSQSFENLGVALASGDVLVSVGFEPQPQSGSRVSGEIVVDGVSAAWSFLAP
jgi:Mg-chelatase subunit ChlD